ncbi:MAG TPA: hypothetical protein VNB64_09270, partial [Solirubrobacteraceae bacterium]|nr:hypothetical protein [Solirubrobacteraceae bacterium]
EAVEAVEAENDIDAPLDDDERDELDTAVHDVLDEVLDDDDDADEDEDEDDGEDNADDDEAAA